MFRILLVALFAQASSLQTTKNLLKVTDSTVHIAEWWGRLGNNLLQLQNALIFAEAKNKTRVTFPTAHGTELKQLVNLPEHGIAVNPKNMEMKETCLRKPPFFYDDFFHNDRRASCFSDVKVRRRVLVTYIKPLLQHPSDDFKTADDELLIHLRSGDMMRPNGISHPQTRQPPCAAYDKVIEEGNNGQPFEHVRIIGEHDHRNPCSDLIVKNHPDKNITVQEKPWLDDAAAIMNARNLVIGTSSFSLEIGLLNENLERAWAAKQTITPEIVGCGYAKQVNLMNIPGLEKIREYDERRRWMKSFKVKEVTIQPMCSKH
jgi:hypothetical protein